MKTILDHPQTWIKYRDGMCDHCYADCCRLPVEVKLSDLIRMKAIDSFEAQEPLKKIAKKLKKAGIIQHFTHKTETFVLTQMANRDCLYLDTQTRRCRIYQQRPETCRNHPAIGPRPHYCPYNKK